MRIRPVAFLACLPAGLPAQISTTPLSPTLTPRSIVLAPQGSVLYAVCSMTQASQQFSIDVTNAVTPVIQSSTTTYGKDQYCDAVWCSDWGGRLLTAHRAGDIQQWDASSGTLSSASPLPTLGMVSTNYSHEGLEVLQHPIGTFVFYSEQHTSPTSFGGLKIYRMNPNSLSFVGQQLFLAGAGGALDFDVYGRYVWQWGDQNASNLNGVLRVYDTNGLTGNPLLVNTVPWARANPYADEDLKRNDTGNVLLLTMGWDGIAAVNVTAPANPLINLQFAMPGTVFFDGVTYVPNTDFAFVWGFVQIGTARTPILLFGNTLVAGGQAWYNFGVLVWPHLIDDVKILNGRAYMLGRNLGNNAANLYIW